MPQGIEERKTVQYDPNQLVSGFRREVDFLCRIHSDLDYDHPVRAVVNRARMISGYTLCEIESRTIVSHPAFVEAIARATADVDRKFVRHQLKPLNRNA